MKRHTHLACLLTVAAAGMTMLPWRAAHAVTLNQVDDFQSGTTANWMNGPPSADPVNVSSGGPAGAGDRFLQAASTGVGGAGSRMVVFNRAQWLGNFNLTGANAIEIDLKNLSPVPAQQLSMRIAFKQTTAMGAAGYVTNTALALPADGSWHHAVFKLAGADMVGINAGGLTLSNLLDNPAEMRILSSAAPSLDGDVIGAKLGIDNIRLVPEPAAESLAVLGFACLVVARCRRSKVIGQ
jgi:hypothetical protein